MNAIVTNFSPNVKNPSGTTVGPAGDLGESKQAEAAGELCGFCEQERVIRGGRVVECAADATYRDEYEMFLCGWCYREMAA